MERLWAGNDLGVSLAETVRLFVVPPLLSFVLVASTMLLFATYRTKRDQHLHPDSAAGSGDVGCSARAGAPPLPPR